MKGSDADHKEKILFEKLDKELRALSDQFTEQIKSIKSSIKFETGEARNLLFVTSNPVLEQTADIIAKALVESSGSIEVFQTYRSTFLNGLQGFNRNEDLMRWALDTMFAEANSRAIKSILERKK